jgi:hypothetical protein
MQQFLLIIISFLFVFNCISQGISCGKKQNYTHKISNSEFLADNSRSDTIDILKYTINLEILDFTGKKIKGNCTVDFSSKQDSVSELNLDLLKLTVDSVTANNTVLNYTYNDTLLSISLPGILNAGDTGALTVYYSGKPQGDASGWGGFYFQGDYAFNLGVGFAANPHVYGRVWFPCFDNFVERSKYEFNISTSGGKVAMCNGYLASEDTLQGDTIARKWIMNEEIPTYLACVAVTNYSTVEQTYQGIQSNVPVELYAKAIDTTAFKNSFVNLNKAMEVFEQYFGPYKWNKVGYSLVPFNSGAMEHATNIAYPKSAANGSLQYETLMAHELSHHWWGDLATCDTQEEMWLNEGWASFCEYLFLEFVYGKAAYNSGIMRNHKDVLHYTHHREGGYLALNAIPHEYTYGEHVYNKGADIAHTLRGYLGDSLFMLGMNSYFNTYQFKDVNSYKLRDHLTLATGVDMSDFFENWVLNPGYPHFSIDSVIYTPSGNGYNAQVYIKQKLKGAPQFYSNVPIEITFIKSDWQEYTSTIIVSGEYSNFALNIPFFPAYATLNKDIKISHAVSDNQLVVKSAGTYNLNESLFKLTVNSVTDSAFLRIEHHWAAPDEIKDTSALKMKISNYRYWTVDGIIPQGFSAKGQITYNGNLSGTGYLDMDLVTYSEDSICLLYRRNASEEWRLYEYYTKNTLGSNPNKLGYIVIDSLVLGEYTFANSLLPLKTEETILNKKIHFYPNPASDEINVVIEEMQKGEEYDVELYDMLGRKSVFGGKIRTHRTIISLKNSSTGIYVLIISDKEGNNLFSEKVIIK